MASNLPPGLLLPSVKGIDGTNPRDATFMNEMNNNSKLTKLSNIGGGRKHKSIIEVVLLIPKCYQRILKLVLKDKTPLILIINSQLYLLKTLATRIMI